MKTSINITILGVFIYLLLLMFGGNEPLQKKFGTNLSKSVTQATPNYDTLTIENVKLELGKTKAKFPKILLAQVIYETGWLKCTECSLDKNNLFGFFNSYEYLSFTTWQSCVFYAERWQKLHYKGGDYYDFLVKKWGAEDMENYIRNIKLIVEKI